MERRSSITDIESARDLYFTDWRSLKLSKRSSQGCGKQRTAFSSKQKLAVLYIHFYYTKEIIRNGLHNTKFVNSALERTLAYLNVSRPKTCDEVQIKLATFKEWKLATLSDLLDSVASSYKGKLKKQRTGFSEMEKHQEEFVELIRKMSSFGMNFRSKQAVRLFCEKRGLKVPARMQRRRLIQIMPMKAKKPSLSFGVKYKNASTWKNERVEFYNKTNNELVTEAMENDWEIFNGDETQLKFDRFNDETKVLVPDNVEAQKSNRHCSKCSFFGCFSDKGKMLRPCLVINQMTGYGNCRLWKEKKKTVVKWGAKTKQGRETRVKEIKDQATFVFQKGGDYGCEVYQRDNSSESDFFTKPMFSHYYEKSLLPALKVRLQENCWKKFNKGSQKILLLLDQAPQHDFEYMRKLDTNVVILALPAGCTSLLQPADCGFLQDCLPFVDKNTIIFFNHISNV